MANVNELLFKSEVVWFISYRVWESKKRPWTQYIMVEYKGQYRIDMLYLENPDPKLEEYFKKLVFWDSFSINTSIKTS